MNEVIEHVPGDQIVRVQAGVKLADVQEQLAGENQMISIDPPEADATIGGVVAANSSGPRRYSYGTIRDLIIGIQVVLADGTVAKAGGKVVKNVAGYDLSKLFTGSMGTLGLIAQANFRLHPIREASRTVVAEIEGGPQQVYEATHSVADTQVEPTSIELRHTEDETLLAVFVESIEGGIQAKVDTVNARPQRLRRGARSPWRAASSGRSCRRARRRSKSPRRPRSLRACSNRCSGPPSVRELDGPKITGHAGTGRYLCRALGR